MRTRALCSYSTPLELLVFLLRSRSSAVRVIMICKYVYRLLRCSCT